MAFIYKITSPNKKVYVGSTIDFERRLKDYKRYLGKGQPKLANSFKKYGIDNHIFELVYECEFCDMYRLEAELGHKLKSIGRMGLNLMLPKHSDIPSKRVISKSTKVKLSIANKGKIRSDEVRLAQSRRLKGKPSKRLGFKASEETRKKISDIAKRRVLSQETKDKISLASGGKKHTEETRNKMRVIAQNRTIKNNRKCKV